MQDLEKALKGVFLKGKANCRILQVNDKSDGLTQLVSIALNCLEGQRKRHQQAVGLTVSQKATFHSGPWTQTLFCGEKSNHNRHRNTTGVKTLCF